MDSEVGEQATKIRPWPPTPPTSIWVQPCPDLDQAVADLAADGFRVYSIGPADEPTYAVMFDPHPELPTVVQLDTVAFHDGLTEPFLKRANDAEPDRGAQTPAPITDMTFSHDYSTEWIVGRAGMRYADLIPGRWNGQFIASHIHIPDGGPVPDYVHFHSVDFQLIFCHRGWVRVVYEDQGEPFVLHPGDAILQAPGIRHQVLESSDDLYVVEISSPADHPTYVEQHLELPNGRAPGKTYGGQQYVHFVYDNAAADLVVGHSDLYSRSLNLEQATGGQYGAEILSFEPSSNDSSIKLPVDDAADFELLVVLAGQIDFVSTDGAMTRTIGSGQSVALSADVADRPRAGVPAGGAAQALLVRRLTA